MDLPPLGSSSFVPLLLAGIADQPSLQGWKPDPTLFSTILISLIVNRGALIVDVDTNEDDSLSKRKQIAHVASHVAAITNGIFGRSTHHAHLNADTTPSSLPYHFLTTSPESRTSVSVSHSHQGSSETRPVATRMASSSFMRAATTTTNRRYVSAASQQFGPVSPSRTPGFSSRLSWTISHPPTPRSISTPGITPVITPSVTSKISTLLPSLPKTESPDELKVTELGANLPYLPQVLILTGLEHTDTPVWIKLMQLLIKRKVMIESEDGVDLNLDLPSDFLLLWIRDNHRDDYPSYLMDRFTSWTSTTSDIPLPPEIPRSPLIPSEYISDLTALLPYTHIHPSLQIHISNLLCAVSAHPRLRSTITGRMLRYFSDFVRAHRLLASPFDLPANWRAKLHRQPGQEEAATRPASRGFGLGGGENGVDTWAEKAGQEPHIRDLRRVKEDETDGEPWYATTANVGGVWQLCLRHRVKARGEIDEIMWVVKRSAAEEETRLKGRRKVPQRIAEKILDELIVSV
ncbi:hypothetical protein BD324DRAFT_612059 [Kockovaella imperatae]|uniref:Uncharacterized protein n=1 Tax=Kockovaella imperatae TaxID=4999 RepID=A0A1Y1US17_9TREE|nr:hypothetical protein BD324DRAFT_612059 [Kockovaella imperatae]ORX40769.1 hypothetical protein BD324DRAFT_612059 [Kockovaella imperatae]